MESALLSTTLSVIAVLAFFSGILLGYRLAYQHYLEDFAKMMIDIAREEACNRVVSNFYGK